MMSDKMAISTVITAEEIGLRLTPFTDVELKRLQDVKDGKRSLADDEMPMIASAYEKIVDNSKSMTKYLIGSLLLDYCCGGKIDEFDKEKKEPEEKQRSTTLGKFHQYLADEHDINFGLSTLYGYVQTAASDRKFIATLNKAQQTQYESLSFSARKLIASVKSDARKLDLLEHAMTESPSFRQLKKYIDESKSTETETKEKKTDSFDISKLKEVNAKLIKRPEILFSEAGQVFITEEKLNKIKSDKKKQALLEAAEKVAENLRSEITENTKTVEELNKEIQKVDDAAKEKIKAVKSEIKKLDAKIKKNEDYNKKYEDLTLKLS